MPIHNHFSAAADDAGGDDDDGAAAAAPFDAIVLRATWDEIVAVATLAGAADACADGACAMAAPAAVRVGVGPADADAVATAAALGRGAAGSSGTSSHTPDRAFDGDLDTFWDGKGSKGARASARAPEEPRDRGRLRESR